MPATATPALTFWQSIDAGLALIRDTRPQTFDDVKTILDEYGNPGDSLTTTGPNATFFGGSGGDATLSAALNDAGWRTTWAEANYYWVKKSPTGEYLTYIEGDVQRGDTAIKG